MKIESSFWDTSALLPICCSQPALSVLSKRFARQFSKKTVWWGTSVEIQSALFRLVQEGALDNREFIAAWRRWEILSNVLYLVEPKTKVKEIAEKIPKTYGLRALDSFQLAAALVWCKEKPRNRPFVCYDKKLADAAEKVGFKVFQ
jgi:predicted nucleic acid-binding protein